MRYTFAVLLALGIASTAAIPAALTQNSPGRACYKDGVVSSCTRPAPFYLGTVLEIHQATATPWFRLSPADSDYATPSPSPGPGYNTGYGTVVQPSQPFWVVQFPL